MNCPWQTGNESRPAVQKALRDLDPKLIVSIERPGMAADGRYYNMRGQDITGAAAKFDLFLPESNVPSIAFGDGGNEIGMGKVFEALAELDIIPSVTRCDELVIASVSNWGVYGVIAVLCDLLNRDFFELDRPRIDCSFLFANGCVDGVTALKEAGEDGFPIHISKSIIQQLRDLVLNQGDTDLPRSTKMPEFYQRAEQLISVSIFIYFSILHLSISILSF